MRIDVDFPELLDMHKRAVRVSVDVVAQMRPDDLDRATPCSAWNLEELLTHMTVQHHGFAAAAKGSGDDPEVWRAQPLGDDPVATYTRAADAVLTAFAEEGVVEREFSVPELAEGAMLPAQAAVTAHLVDYVIHGWDVARSLDVPFKLDSDVIDTTLQVVSQIPDGPERRNADSPFGPAHAVPEDASQLDRVLLLVGRLPAWPN